eukprot:IDg15679t1
MTSHPARCDIMLLNARRKPCSQRTKPSNVRSHL